MCYSTPYLYKLINTLSLLTGALCKLPDIPIAYVRQTVAYARTHINSGGIESFNSLLALKKALLEDLNCLGLDVLYGLILSEYPLFLARHFFSFRGFLSY